jgi:hypothetical protein
MADNVTHLMKERRPGKNGVVTLCGINTDWASFWASDVTCPDCLAKMERKKEHIL